MESAAKKIWLVDDEPDVLAYLVAALEDEGYDVQGFASAGDVLPRAETSPPDLICLDILMPECSGLSLYKRLREEPCCRAVPIIIVSGYSKRTEFVNGEFRRLIGDATTPPPDGFVEKPVPLDDFLALVGRLARGGSKDAAA